MNLYLRELKAHRKSIIIWSIAMIFLIFAGFSKYSAGAADGAQSFNVLIADMPKSLQNLFGVGIYDLSKLVDYYGVFYLYIALMATIHAVMLGNTILAKEERDKTAEFLLVKPISRNGIIIGKLLCAVTLVIILNLVTWISSILAFEQFSKGEAYSLPLMKLMLGLFGMQILFLLLGSLLAAFTRRYQLSSSIGTGILMVMFFLSVVIDISGKLNFLKGLTIFKYFDAKDILKIGYNYIYLIAACIIAAVFTYGTFYFYKKRDMKV